MKTAIKKANKIPFVNGNQRVYAIITDKRGNILSEGANDYTKSSPHMKYYASKGGFYDKIFWHAECRALHYMPKDKKPYKITIARVNKNGELLSSKPCALCQLAIRQHNVKVIEHVI